MDQQQGVGRMQRLGQVIVMPKVASGLAIGALVLALFALAWNWRNSAALWSFGSTFANADKRIEARIDNEILGPTGRLRSVELHATETDERVKSLMGGQQLTADQIGALRTDMDRRLTDLGRRINGVSGRVNAVTTRVASDDFVADLRRRLGLGDAAEAEVAEEGDSTTQEISGDGIAVNGEGSGSGTVESVAAATTPPATASPTPPAAEPVPTATEQWCVGATGSVCLGGRLYNNRQDAERVACGSGGRSLIAQIGIAATGWQRVSCRADDDGAN